MGKSNNRQKSKKSNKQAQNHPKNKSKKNNPKLEAASAWAGDIVAEPDWADDIAYDSLDKEIELKHEANNEAFRPLSETVAVSLDGKPIRKPLSGFYLFLIIWLSSLALLLSIFLYKFYYFLNDYQTVYSNSLPYHVVDNFITYFENGDYESLYNFMDEKPETSEFETKENVKGYMESLLASKEITYVETAESTDKEPSYNIMADGYIVAKLYLIQSESMRSYKLPYYEIDSFEFYTDPSRSVAICAPENCTVYLNNIPVSESYTVNTAENKYQTHFKDFENLPDIKYYKISGMYEMPDIKVINCFGQDCIPKIDNSTGYYSINYACPVETSREMTDFAKTAVSVYAKVVCRDLADSALDRYFTKNNEIVREIKSNASNLKWFPGHKTASEEWEIVEFVPITESAFYCEVKYTQHLLIYGVRPEDVVTNAKFYYVKEDGNWKICSIIF